MNRNDRGFRAEYTNISRTQRQGRAGFDGQPYVQRGQPQRIQQSPRNDPRAMRQVRPVNQPRNPQRRRPPINDPRLAAQVTLRQGQSRHKPIRRKNTTLRDFLLGLGIGFAVFGTAAIFVVRAIIDLLV